MSLNPQVKLRPNRELTVPSSLSAYDRSLSQVLIEARRIGFKTSRVECPSDWFIKFSRERYNNPFYMGGIRAFFYHGTPIYGLDNIEEIRLIQEAEPIELRGKDLLINVRPPIRFDQEFESAPTYQGYEYRDANLFDNPNNERGLLMLQAILQQIAIAQNERDHCHQLKDRHGMVVADRWIRSLEDLIQ